MTAVKRAGAIAVVDLSSSERNRIIALIPAHNEAGRIEPVIAGAQAYLPVWVVDDGSSDDTALLPERDGAVVLRQSPNQGKGADLIIGERDFSHMPPLRKLSNSLGGRAFSWAVGRTVRDNQSGYRLIRRRLMEAMVASTEQGFEFEVDMIVTCVQRRFAMAGVAIRTIYAGQGSHIHNVRHAANFLRMVWQTRKARKQM